MAHPSDQGNEIEKSANLSKGPGVYIPPPFFYVVTFLAAVFAQKKCPIAPALSGHLAFKVGGALLSIAAAFFLSKSLRQFFKTKNTVVLIRPASSLQTTGVYGISRNPMYVGLAFLYFAIACFIGSAWNLILLPALFLVIQEYVIKREERYLGREFGPQYEDYKKKVRRWL